MQPLSIVNMFSVAKPIQKVLKKLGLEQWAYRGDAGGYDANIHFKSVSRLVPAPISGVAAYILVTRTTYMDQIVKLIIETLGSFQNRWVKT